MNSLMEEQAMNIFDPEPWVSSKEQSECNAQRKIKLMVATEELAEVFLRRSQAWPTCATHDQIKSL